MRRSILRAAVGPAVTNPSSFQTFTLSSYSSSPFKPTEEPYHDTHWNRVSILHIKAHTSALPPRRLRLFNNHPTGPAAPLARASFRSYSISETPSIEICEQPHKLMSWCSNAGAKNANPTNSCYNYHFLLFFKCSPGLRACAVSKSLAKKKKAKTRRNLQRLCGADIKITNIFFIFKSALLKS